MPSRSFCFRTKKTTARPAWVEGGGILVLAFVFWGGFSSHHLLQAQLNVDAPSEGGRRGSPVFDRGSLPPSHYNSFSHTEKAPRNDTGNEDFYARRYGRSEHPGRYGDEAQPTGNNIESGFLLLKSGYVLQGKVNLRGETYSVTTSDAQVDVPRDSVEHLGRSMFELYLYQKSKISSSDINAMIELADWCQRHGLEEESREEFHRALERTQQPTIRAFIERRMKMAQYLTQVQEQSPVDNKDLSPIKRELKTLEEWSEKIPRMVLADFVGDVQLLLVNRCGMADCHNQYSEQSFRLKRVGTDAGSRPNTLRNLRATLQLVDRKDPKASSLLTVPIRPHGGTEAIFTKRTLNQYKQIMDWVQMVATEMPHFRQSIEELALESIFPDKPASGALKGDDPLRVTREEFPPANGDRPDEFPEADAADRSRPPTISAGFFSPDGSPQQAASALYDSPGAMPAARGEKNPLPHRREAASANFEGTLSAGRQEDHGDSGFGESIDMTQVRRIREAQLRSTSPFPSPESEPNEMPRNRPIRQLRRAGVLPEFTPRDPFDPEIFNRRSARPPTP